MGREDRGDLLLGNTVGKATDEELPRVGDSAGGRSPGRRRWGRGLCRRSFVRFAAVRVAVTLRPGRR